MPFGYRNGKWASRSGKFLGAGGSVQGAVIGYPAGLAAQEINDISVILMWTEPAHDNPLANYKIYKDGFLEATITDTLETSYDVTGLTESTSYAFTMTAEDSEGNVSEISPPLNITTVATEENTPVAVFQFDGASTGNSPLSISVTSFSNSNGPNPITLHFWDWGDGTTKSGGFQNEPKTYNAPGTYPVQLRITVDGVDYFSDHKNVIVTSAVADTEAPTSPGKPNQSSATSNSNTINFAPGTDNIGIDRYNIFADTDTSEPATLSEIHLGGLDSTTLNSGSNLIRTTFDVPPAEMEDDPNGVRLKFSVTNAYPAVVDDRQELRETDISTTPANDTTIEYDSIFTLEDIPSVVYEVFTIMQLFDHGGGAPVWNVHITGENQYPGTPGDANLLQIYEDFGGSRTKIAGTYLKVINHLKVVHYFNSVGGYVAWFLNGQKLLEVTGQDTSPSGATAVQFGCYPHGYQDSASGRTDQVNSGEVDFSFLMHSFTKRVFQGAIPIADFKTYDFNLAPDFTASGTSGSHIGLLADTTYRYAVQSQDLAGNKSAPSLQGSMKTLVAPNPGSSNYPSGAIVDLRAWSAAGQISGNQILDISGNSNHLDFQGTPTDRGITASGSFTPSSTWPAWGTEGVMVEVTRYHNQGNTKVYQFNGAGNSLWFDQKYMGIKANTNGNFESNFGFSARSQPSWFHIHIVVFNADGSAELWRSMGEPLSGWEYNTLSEHDYKDLYQGRSLQTIAIESGNEFRHFQRYPALSAQDLADLKSALLTEHKSPYTAGAFPDLSNYTLQAQTFFENVSDPAAEARGANMLNAAGGVKLDRTISEVHTDSNGVSYPCLRMAFDNSHGGWGKGQRFMNLNSDQNNLHEEVIIEFPYCVADLDLNTSLGAKMMPSISFGGVPPPCQPIPMNEGYISGMNRPQWRNTIAGNEVIDGAVVHTYNYFNNALDPCGQHMYGYLPDGTFHLLKNNVWDVYRIRLKLNDIGQANGIYQMQINGILAQSDSNIEMRDDVNVKLQKLTCELFSGGSWSWNGSGYVRIGNIKVYYPT